MPAGRLHNWIEDPTDPTMLKMDVTYGPMSLFDVDAMEDAVNEGKELDDSMYYDAWWFQLSIEGTTIALREGDYVISYMAWENPSVEGAWEQWSCVGQYQEFDGVFDGDVYNYVYNSPVLVNDEVERNGDSIDYQTLYHSNYLRDGPWHLASSKKYYSTLFRLSRDVAAMNCSGIRKMESDKAAFNPKIDTEVNMKVGFRIYSDANDQVARHFKDYPAVTFELKFASRLFVTASAIAAVVFMQNI